MCSSLEVAITQGMARMAVSLLSWFFDAGICDIRAVTSDSSDMLTGTGSDVETPHGIISTFSP